jgi:hypothetical protein
MGTAMIRRGSEVVKSRFSARGGNRGLWQA